MNWYLAKIVFQIITEKEYSKGQFDEQLRLIKADDHDEAIEKATTIGEKEQELFYNQRNKPVRWQFVGVAELLLLDTLRDGMEVYSRTEENPEPEKFIQLIQKKEENLRQQSVSKYLLLI
jgi:Domain of unknown function (DUF4288)